MLNKLQKSKSNRSDKGFTIIEVMIVLAIAGLILLIVFLAVPALQRSSRNTQRKTDIGRLGAAATTVVANLNGQAVTNANFAGAILTGEVGTLGYYTAANVTAALGAGANLTNNTNNTSVSVLYNAKCSGSNAIAQPRQIAILYSTETAGNGSSKACLDQ